MTLTRPLMRFRAVYRKNCERRNDFVLLLALRSPNLKPLVPASCTSLVRIGAGFGAGAEAASWDGCFTRCNERTPPALATSISDIIVHAMHRDCKALAP